MPKLDRNVGHGQPGAIWVDPDYEEGFAQEKISCYVRPDNRTDPTKPTGNALGVPNAVRVILVKGDPKADPPILPVFKDDAGITIELTDCSAKPAKDLTPKDLAGAAPDYATPELVISHINKTYGRMMTLDDIVTVFRFKYLPNVLHTS